MSQPPALGSQAGNPVIEAPEPPRDLGPPPGMPPADAPPPGDALLGAPPPVVAPRNRPSYVFLAVVSIVTLAADIGTKLWAEKALQTATQMPTPKQVIKGVFGFVLAKNKGGAWGLLQGSAENIRKPFFVVVSVLAIAFIVSLYRRLHERQSALKWGLPLVLGGALGNLVDRIRYGYVIDFIDWQATWGGTQHHWPTFNVADIAICVGVALMAIDMLTARRSAVPAPPIEPPAPPSDVAAPPPPHELQPPGA